MLSDRTLLRQSAVTDAMEVPLAFGAWRHDHIQLSAELERACLSAGPLRGDEYSNLRAYVMRMHLIMSDV
jgi:hypothetical protein